MNTDIRIEVTSREVQIPTGAVTLPGVLGVPTHPDGLILLTRHDRFRQEPGLDTLLARHLHEAGLATLLLDLLTDEELEQEPWANHLDLNIGLLKQRLEAAAHWAAGEDEALHRPLGILAFGTASAAALVAAADLGSTIAAVVSCGGRPDLAGNALRRIKAPTLLVVAGEDDLLLEFNEDAHEMLTGETILTVLPNAPKSLESEQATEEVARLAAKWFLEHLGPYCQARSGRSLLPSI